jgi:S-adenosylmethionine decarboxylase
LHALAKHLVLELGDCNREALDDLDLIKRVLYSAARELGVTVIGDNFHRFEPQGISGIIFVAESHLAIHTWPEYGYAAVDIFTCGDSFHPQSVAHLLIRDFDSRSPTVIELRRGVLTSPGGEPLRAGTTHERRPT